MEERGEGNWLIAPYKALSRLQTSLKHSGHESPRNNLETHSSQGVEILGTIPGCYACVWPLGVTLSLCLCGIRFVKMVQRLLRSPSSSQGSLLT